MKTILFRLSSLLTFVILTACSSGPPTKCDDALTKAQQCGFEVELGDTGEECSPIAECMADCYLAANCGEIDMMIPFGNACTRSCG
jgi:hypothetical protein